jgi:hypothetical protein
VRNLALFILVFFGAQAFTQVSDAYIRWGDKKLSWEDFAGPIIESSEFDALTYSAIALSFRGRMSP